MIESFPLEYSLESGTHVVVNKVAADTYEFLLSPVSKPAEKFTYVDGETTKAEWDERLDFEQLEALRKFWLDTEDVV